MKNYMSIEISQLEFRQIVREEVRRVLSESGIIKAIGIKEDLLDADQAAIVLKVKKSTLYALTSRNEVPSMKKGKRLHFRRSELLAYIESGRKNPVNGNDLTSKGE